MSKNALCNKILKSGFSGSNVNAIGHRLMDYHILDNGNVYYTFVHPSNPYVMPMTLTIEDFGLMWDINMIELLNSI